MLYDENVEFRKAVLSANPQATYVEVVAVSVVTLSNTCESDSSLGRWSAQFHYTAIQRNKNERIFQDVGHVDQ
jgi:hypothetical protein